MSDEKLNQIIKAVDSYIDIIENPNYINNLNIVNMKMMFDNCLFIESLLKKLKDENKENEFESHLNNYMKSEKNKRISYKFSDLENSCDKILEICLKNNTIETSVIDEFLKIYISQYGNKKLDNLINKVLFNSMQTKAIIEILEYIDCPASDIENEVILASWNNDLNLGKEKEIIEIIKNMFKDGQISKLVEIANKSDENSLINSLLLNCFAIKLTDYNEILFKILALMNKKKLIQFLKNDKFKDSFIDALFYFGRNLEHNDEDDSEEKWISKTEITYDIIINILKNLLNSTDKIAEFVTARINLAKQLDEELWKDIENDL